MPPAGSSRSSCWSWLTTRKTHLKLYSVDMQGSESMPYYATRTTVIWWGDRSLFISVASCYPISSGGPRRAVALFSRTGNAGEYPYPTHSPRDSPWPAQGDGSEGGDSQPLPCLISRGTSSAAHTSSIFRATTQHLQSLSQPPSPLFKDPVVTLGLLDNPGEVVSLFHDPQLDPILYSLAHEVKIIGSEDITGFHST